MALDPNQEARMLAQRAREKALAQTRAAHIAQATDHEGKVKVWDVKTGTPRMLWAVDAREQIERGLATLEPPLPPPVEAEPAAEPPAEMPPPATEVNTPVE